jgi:hypothetical protein
MKKTIIFFSAAIFSIESVAQSKDFEGIITYKVDVHSKTDGVSDKIWWNMTALGDNVMITVKQGNYRQVSGISDIYFINKKQRAYFRFRGYDTLYYMNYADDTTSVLGFSKTGEKKTIAGFDCTTLSVQTPGATRKYYTAPALYLNPDYDKNNRISQTDLVARETQSLVLGFDEVNDSYTMSQIATKVDQLPVDDKVFELPSLPEKKFSIESFMKPPSFNRTGGFMKYVELNVDGNLGAKYIKIPKGEKETSQTVEVVFMINEKGKVVNARVVNKDEVHPKLAEEALRVVAASPPWAPATIFGEKTIFYQKQLVTFQLSKN